MWRCGFCFLQHPRLTLLSFLFRIRTPWSGRHESKGSQEFTLSLSFEMLKPVHCAGLKLAGRGDGSPPEISFRARATKHPSLFLSYKAWHLCAFDLQRSPLFHNISSSWVTVTNLSFSLFVVENVNWEEWLGGIRIWVFHDREMSSVWSWLLWEGESQ